MQPYFNRATATDLVMVFFLEVKNLLSFQRAKAQSLLSQKKPFLPSYTGAPQRGQVPTASCFPLASGNSLANRSSGAVCSFTSSRHISVIPSIKVSADSSLRSTCFSIIHKSGNVHRYMCMVNGLDPCNLAQGIFQGAPLCHLLRKRFQIDRR